jgi:tetratricopeptide (TPR) repeat protein
LAGLPAGAAEDRMQRLATALRVLIAAVKREPNPATRSPELTTELMAASYYEQSLAVKEESLETALRLAKQAATNSPAFGFAWERVAELEFSFGRVDRATRAFEKSYVLSPRNAEALALQGFLLAAENKTKEAIVWFQYAIDADSSLGNAWLGRGLCRIRRRDLAGGREDLLMAAALEPQRALLRSYLGKAYGEAADYGRATRELDRAKYLDLNDPTSWLYSALLNQQYNRINEAIRDLERSQELNDNRSVYRSALLLDQDAAVRSANLAGIYADADMLDLSIREASRAVSYDYANYSAHLFLANSYNEIRDPLLISGRLDTAAQDEFLIASLLAPVAAGPISPTLSQQDYSKRFEQNRFGVVSDTEYLSRGSWRQWGAIYGAFEHSWYDFEVNYRTDPGQRVNDDITQRTLFLAMKQEVTPSDSVFLQVQDFKAEGGDLLQYFDPASANPLVRTRETQEPSVAVGFHHEWSPGVHTLFLAGRLTDTFSVKNPSEPILFNFGFSGTDIAGVRLDSANQDYTSTQRTYSTELQQILELSSGTTIAGARVQWGKFHLRNLQTDAFIYGGIFENPQIAASQDFEADFQRESVYAYEYWQLADSLMLVGGVCYDHVEFPQNFRLAPLTTGTTVEDQVSPKAGIIWSPLTNTIIRAAYTRSLGGASIDQDFRLEPTEVAGFNQSFRSIIPESIAGANSGAKFESYGVSIEQKFETGTYLGVAGEVLNSTVERTVGIFRNDGTKDFAYSSGIHERLSYQEPSLQFTADQLLGRDWSLGVRYQVTKARLNDDYTDIPDLSPDLIDYPFRPRQELDSILHHLNLHATFNHPLGLFATAEAEWYSQGNSGYLPELPGSDFWQFNVFFGYRFLQRRAEVTIGVLNLANKDYRLSPLTIYSDLPRKRTLTLGLQLNF